MAGEPTTVVDVLRKAASENGDVEAYVEYIGSADSKKLSDRQRRSLTFGELDLCADAVASVFAQVGVEKGDVVALLLPSSIEYAVCYHAAMRLGAVTSGVNPRLGPQEKSSIFGRLGPRSTVIEGSDDGAIEKGIVIERQEITDLIAAGGGEKPARLPRIDPSDPVAVVWTGGSTGIPKGALFDHRNLEAVVPGQGVLSIPNDRRVSPLPFAHVGYMTRAWDEIEKLITTVITPTPWNAGEAIELLETEAITVGQGVPTQWTLVLAHPSFEAADLSSLRLAGTGAARVPPELVREMRERLGCPVVVRYTSTEMSIGTGTLPGDPDDVVATTVGRPVPTVELELVGSDGARVREGEVGVVRTRSKAVMRGYVGNGTTIDREATDATIDQDGWVTTGDLGRMGSDGNLRLVGRSTEMIIRGGYNVYPSEVEAVLGKHPAVGQVTVVGAADPVLGEIIFCFLVPRAGFKVPQLKELRDLCKGSLADYKAPDRLEVLDELPATALGKIDTRSLVARANEIHQSEGARA